MADASCTAIKQVGVRGAPTHTALVLIGLTISGCANMDSIYRKHTFDLHSPVSESAFIDAKQREIIAGNYTVCPSPQGDIMMTYAAELAGKADISDKAKAELAMAAQSSAAYVGVRSRNIQFSRDQIYSLCIDRMNDAVDDGQYNFYKSRLHRYQMAMASIEQLTDPATWQPVILSSKGSATLSGPTAHDENTLAALEKEKTESVKTGGPKADGQNLTTEETKKIKDLDEQIKKLKETIEASTSAASSHSAGIIDPAITRSGSLSKETVEAVTKIVISTLLTDDSNLMCMERLINIENQINEAREQHQDRNPNAAEMAEIKYCTTVLEGRGTPLMKLSPELTKWITQ
ncbi:hypothetical protein PS3A_35370 [Pseudomonas sp. 3A(2025)]